MTIVKPCPIIAPDGTILFTTKELGQRTTQEGILAPGFAVWLAELRLRFDRPMIVNSCCRSAGYNEQVGGHAKSLHVYDEPYHPTGGSCAIDIRTSHLTKEKAELYRRLLKELAWESGWSIGLYTNFIHLDRRVDYTNKAQALFRGAY